MAYPYSSEVARFNPQRRAIYTMLLNTAGREWTVATLTASLRGSVPADAVRSSLDTLLAHGLMIQVPGHQEITAQLTDEGATALSLITEQWRRSQAPPSSP